MFGDVLGKGELDEDAVDGGVVVELVDGLEKLGFCYVLAELDELAIDVGLAEMSAP